MARGYPSNIAGDDTVMDSPEATLFVDLHELAPQQALAIMKAQGLDNYSDSAVGMVVKGERYPEHGDNAEFYMPVEAAITALIELNVCGLGEEEVEEEAEEPITNNTAAAAKEATNE